MVTYSNTKVAELLPFNQPKGSCGNVGLFIPEMIDGGSDDLVAKSVAIWQVYVYVSKMITA